VKSFADQSFFRVLDTLIGAAGGAPGSFKTGWTHQGVDVERSKHSSTAPGYNFTVEVCQLSKVGQRPWRLIAVKEYWHLEGASGLPRQVRWAKLVSGRRTDALTWFKQRGDELERHWAEASERLYHGDSAVRGSG
jgi:hypothetical protein